MDIKDISPFSVTGNEEELANLIANDIKPMWIPFRLTPWATLSALKGEIRPKVMLAAHMDEIGFVVTFIDKSGLIRVSNVGAFVPSTRHITRLYLKRHQGCYRV